MKGCLLFLILLGVLFWNLGTVAETKGQTLEETFAAGNKAYVEGDFVKALERYRNVSKEGVSAQLFYNMAGAYYRKGDIGLSVLYYERARILAPRNPDIEANLRLVRENAGLFVEANPIWVNLLESFSIDTWTRIGFVAFALLAVSVFVRALVAWTSCSPVPRLSNFGRILMLGLFVVLSVAAAGFVRQNNELNKWVMTAPEAKLFVSPFASAENRGTVKTGTVVQVRKSYENFVLIANKEGLSGWLERSSVQPILPEDA